MGDNGTDVELQVIGLEFEAGMLLEENHCTQSISWTEYVFADRYRHLFWASAEVVYDGVVMEKVKGEESCVEATEI